MSSDLSDILSEWPYEPGQINVRVIEGDDGEPKIQMRLDLGMLQMEVTGRPDGQRPQNCESLLEYFESILDDYAEGRPPPSVMDQEGRDEGSAPEGDAEPQAGGAVPDGPEAEGPPRGPGEIDFALSPDDCRQLREEAVQYYHRYVCLMVLDEFDGVIRDTTRNLRVVDLCSKYAETEQDRQVLEQFRPYITMMRARAMASQFLRDNEPKAAVLAVDEGLEALRKYFSETGQMESFDDSSEVQILKGMRDALTPKLPVSQKSELKTRLAQALEHENYELAAILRDELKNLKD